jgi:DNA ligase-1
MNKALDYGKLLESQKQGKLLKKKLVFPIYVQIKYDGAYATIIVKDGKPTYYSSKPKVYLHPTDRTFDNAVDGVYIAERYYGDGKLGLRTETALFGTKSLQTARSDNKYKIHDYLTLEEYERGYSDLGYSYRLDRLIHSGIETKHIVQTLNFSSIETVEIALEDIVKDGYEGIVMKSPKWRWERTKSRTVDFCKWKKRPTADLLCIDVTEGTGKYEGMIGALILQDSQCRIVQVGSGLIDSDRARDKSYFIGEVIEIEYEQIMETYIQPTFITLRKDKDTKDID